MESAANITDIQVIAHQEPGLATFSNYAELHDQLQGVHDYYMSIDYTNAPLEDAEADHKAIKKARKILTDAKKELKTGYTMPFEQVEAQLDELIDLLKEPERYIKAHIDEIKKSEKRDEVMAYAAEKAAALGAHATKIIESPTFFNQKWLNATCRPKQWREAVDEIISQAAGDLDTIERAGGENKAVLLARYYETLSMEGTKEFLSNLQIAGVNDSAEVEEVDDGDAVVGYRVLKVYGTERQMLKIADQLELSGMDYEVLEDGMPKPMAETEAPDFRDFVCFDIETTGTFGIANGDADAEITEIGAVKVVDGEVVERFDMLANPGRRIVPRIARLTHITDEMVAGEPPVDEVIARFAEFCQGFTLVGHNVKSCDIPHISRAAKRAGVAMENEYFDTYQFAKKFKAAQGWDNVKLEYLSQQFGLQHEDAHRAWCDAEANVGVFFKLKELA